MSKVSPHFKVTQFFTRPSLWLLAFFCILLLSGARLIRAEEGEYAPSAYTPFTFANAINLTQQHFLPEARAWERIDVWVPKDLRAEKLPCVIFFYGGGYFDKIVACCLGKEIQALLDHGYVVALPDYMLAGGNPEPQVVWDGQTAITWLRDHAQTFRIDPERIGAWGFSAGGWLLQKLAPADHSALMFVTKSYLPGQEETVAYPVLNPRIRQSAKLQAFVTDWGARRFAEQYVLARSGPFVTSTAPPMLTCHNDATGKLPPGAAVYKAAGAPTEVAYLNVENTHVPSTSTLTQSVDGASLITWRERIIDFFDRHLKHPTIATAPEFYPASGLVTTPIEVTISSIHPDAAMYYTTDGSPPTAQSTRYTRAFAVHPGQTLKAIAIKPGLRPSPVASSLYAQTQTPPPEIVTEQTAYTTKVGQSFTLTLEARTQRPVTWGIAGKLGDDFDFKKDPPIPHEIFTINKTTGEIHGTPVAIGTYVFVVTCNSIDGETILADARPLTISVIP